MINPIPFPAIQGVRTDHSSLQFTINGVSLFPGGGSLMKYGLTSWTWKSGLAPEALEAAAAQPVGWTRGKYSGDGEFEWFRADGDNLEQFLMMNANGQGLYEIWFLIQAFVNEPSLPLPSSIAAWARIKERSSESKSGGKHTKKYPLLYAAIMENNVIETTGLVFPGKQVF
jgi:hypothetical protein